MIWTTLCHSDPPPRHKERRLGAFDVAAATMVAEKKEGPQRPSNSFRLVGSRRADCGLQFIGAFERLMPACFQQPFGLVAQCVIADDGDARRPINGP